MKHYSNEEWGDFANGTVSPLQKQAMVEHLNSKCEKCNALASVWQKIQRAAAQEHLFQPPADIVHLVKSEFANSGYGKEPGLLGVLAELIFDSAQNKPWRACALSEHRVGKCCSTQIRSRLM